MTTRFDAAAATVSAPSPSSTPAPELRYFVARPDPRSDAVLAFLFETIGVRGMPCDPPALWDGPHVVYGHAAPARPSGISIPERPDDLLWPDVIAAHEAAPLGGDVPFDIISAIGSFLRDDVHRDADPEGLDDHGRLTYAASWPAKVGLGDLPIVNAYVAYFERLVRGRLGLEGRPRWPEGRRAAIGLSHDVDQPDKYAMLECLLRPWRLRGRPRSAIRWTAELARARLRDRAPRDWWLFDEVMDSEARRGLSSTFFFAPTTFHSTRGTRLDVAYDVSAARFRPVFRAMREGGFEVAMHAGYRAHEHARWLIAERRRLSDAAGSEIRGIRHHYWHLGPDIEATLRSHEQAGFAYDSSLAFNDHLGFRRSVALPFHPFDPVLHRPLRTLQLPSFCMDGNLFHASTDVDPAVAAVSDMIERIVDGGGIGTIDWHIQTSYPGNREFRVWAVAYQAILDMLAGRQDIWVTDLGAIERWVSCRAAALVAR
ncbi:MAG: hypothetical protein WCH74_12115 [Chloroflexota bacterium]